MKKCSHCKEEKLETEFYFRNRKLGILQYACKLCTSVQGRAQYQRNTEHVKTKSKHNKRLRRSNYISSKVVLQCCRCEEDYSSCMEFHHLDPSVKDFEISSKVHNCTREALRLELSKCIVVCANCHRKIHGGVVDITPEMLHKSAIVVDIFLNTFRPVLS